MFLCSLCPHRCRAMRNETAGGGRCGLPSSALVTRAALHHGEEPCISGEDPTRGSGTVFFGGCTLSCVFCQNHAISRGPAGVAVDEVRLAEIFKNLVEQGAHNINLVSPTPYVPVIRKALKRYRPPVPIVYNCGGYERVETLRALEGLVDVYLPDFKYASDTLAEELSGATDYTRTALDAIAEMVRQTGPLTVDEHGIAQRGTVVRHLVLPGHTNDSIRCLSLLKERLPAGVYVSLMFQYTPMGEVAGHPELSRRLTARECDKVWNALVERELTDGYVQTRDSAGTDMIPAFDLTGL